MPFDLLPKSIQNTLCVRALCTKLCDTTLESSLAGPASKSYRKGSSNLVPAHMRGRNS